MPSEGSVGTDWQGRMPNIGEQERYQGVCRRESPYRRVKKVSPVTPQLPDVIVVGLR